MKRLCGFILIMLLGTTLPVGAAAEALHSDNVRSLGAARATDWVHRATFHKDLLYLSYAYNASGFDIYRLGDEDRPLEKQSTFPCPGNGEGTIAHWKNFVFQALEMPGEVTGSDPAAEYHQSLCGEEPGGIRVVDVSDPRNPHKVGFISLLCGSHGITLVPHQGRLLIYNSNACSDQAQGTGSTGQGGLANTAFRIEVIEFNARHPSKSEVVEKPAFGGPGDPDSVNGCHDITVYPPRDLAVCTGVGRWALLDISDPYNPRRISTVTDGNLGAGSAQFTWDGQHVVMNEIPFKSLAYGESCAGPQRDETHGIRIWNVEDRLSPKEVGYYRLQREPPLWSYDENDWRCHAANFTVVPMKDPHKYVAVTSWGAAGLSVIDFTDPAKIVELAFWQPQAARIMWWSAWYNGRVYVGENHVQGEGSGIPIGLAGRGRKFAEARALEVGGLGERETRYFKHGLVTQWQDPADLKR